MSPFAVNKFDTRQGVTPTPQELARRKKYLGATVITCIGLAVIFGVGHVVKLGANRMEDMRARATYDLKDEREHIRAAGEDIVRHQEHEKAKRVGTTYGQVSLEGLLRPEQWQDLASEVLVPGGSFMMGTNFERADVQDQPAHRAEVHAFLIDKYPVTNAQYARFVVDTKRRPPLDWENGQLPDGKTMHPVTMVSWFDAKAYCGWAGKRLPTEIEWEKAARGNDGRRWPWGDTMDAARVNTYYNVGSTNEVTRYPNGASPYGVMDMAGNVSQWTASGLVPYVGTRADAEFFKPKVMATTSEEDKRMKVADLVVVENTEYKVRRGGSWKGDPFSTSSYHRDFSLPHYASDFFGFRCARDAH